MAVASVSASELLGKQKDCLENLLLLIQDFGPYWLHQAGGDAKPFAEELEGLKKWLRETPEPSLALLTRELQRLLAGREQHLLRPLCVLAEQAERRETAGEAAKKLRQLLREAKAFVFEREVKSKQEALAKASGDKVAQARFHYDLGVLYVKKDPVQYAKQALEHFNLAIGLEAGDIRAYALRERAALQEEEPLKRADLEQAYKILKSLKPESGEVALKERWRVFFAYGQILLASKDFAGAAEVFSEARQLRTTHGPTISALFQAYHGLKNYRHPLECLQDIELDGRGLADVNVYFTEMGRPLWLELAACGSLALIERCAPYLDKQAVDKDGNNALHYAAKAGHLEVSERLGYWLAYESPNRKGLTPLMVAAQHGRVSLVEYLLKQGASPVTEATDILSVIISNRQGCVLLALAEKEKSYEDLLIQAGRRYIARGIESKEAHEACRIAAVGRMYRLAIDAQDTAMLGLLITRHPEGLGALYEGEAPLHAAVQKRFAAGVRLLAEQGADLAQENLRKQTALELAKDNVELAAYLQNLLGKKKRISRTLQTFIDSIVKQFQEAAARSDFIRPEPLNCLKQSLNRVFSKSVHYPLFEEGADKLPQLSQALASALAEKIQPPDAVTSGSTFDTAKLMRLMEAVADSLQRKPAPQPEHKAEAEQKSVSEAGLLSPAAVLFCERFERQLDEAYGYFRALSSGEAVSVQALEEQQKIKAAQAQAAALPSVKAPVLNVPVPVGDLASGAIGLMLYLRQRFQKKQAERMMSVFRAVTPLERAHFIRYTAEQLVRKYHAQLHHLMPGSEGVEQFADCAAARVVEYITSDDGHQVAYEPSQFTEAVRVVKSWVLDKEIPPAQRRQKSLYDVFLQGIVRVTSEFPKEKERLKTINQLTLTDNWTSKGIFEGTGIILETGERYAHPSVDIERYGYCLGTLEEASKRTLTLGPSKGRLWGAGRDWPAFQAVSPTSPSPLLPAYQAQRAPASPPPALVVSPSKSGFRALFGF